MHRCVAVGYAKRRLFRLTLGYMGLFVKICGGVPPPPPETGRLGTRGTYVPLCHVCHAQGFGDTREASPFRRHLPGVGDAGEDEVDGGPHVHEGCEHQGVTMRARRAMAGARE